MQHASRRWRPAFIALLAVLTAPLATLASQPVPESLADRLVSRPLFRNGSELRMPRELSAEAERLESALLEGRARVERFFGSEYPDAFAVTLVPGRDEFSAVLREAWGVPETACWMVATGVADFLVLLAPSAWETDACEHPGDDPGHVREIVLHELVHVYHAQRNPTGDFAGAEELAWFIEGLAVLAAGQLDGDRLAPAGEAVREGMAPHRLADAWSGRYRYGVSGSLVRYVDRRWGRETLRTLLPLTSQRELLDVLGVTETELLTGWREWVLADG